MRVDVCGTASKPLAGLLPLAGAVVVVSTLAGVDIGDDIGDDVVSAVVAAGA